MKFDIKKKLCIRSERVKCVELHPELTWVLAALYSGNISIYDYSNQSTVKSFEVSNSPVRCARFIARKQWIISGADDLLIRIHNYNTMEKVKQFEAHGDYVRCIEIHPTLPIFITSSDDAQIKVWDFEQGCKMLTFFDDHEHYVMQVVLNPRDPNLFASASLDKTVKVWNLNSKKVALYTLKGHTNGVNCVGYYRGDKPYIISGGDDRCVKIWDYQTKQCLHTLESHDNNISAVMFHPEMPVILTCSEDGMVKIWNNQTFRLESNIQQNMDRGWSLDVAKENSNIIAIGYDEGTVVIKLGSDEPIISMNNGKLIYAKNMEIFSVNLKALNTTDNDIKDNEKLSVNAKELGNCEIYPQKVKHSPNGHIFSVSNENEYVLYRSQTFKNQGYGSGMDVVWSSKDLYAYREGKCIIVNKGANNQQVTKMEVDYQIEDLFGGPLLCVKSSSFLVFYSWDNFDIVYNIDVNAKQIYWNDKDTHLTIQSQDDFYVLEYDKDAQGSNDDQDGVDGMFTVKYEIHEQITSGLWVSELFFFTNSQGKLNYSTNGFVFNYAHTNKKNYIVGYIQSQNRLYLVDKSFNVIKFDLPIVVAEFQSLISNSQIDQARLLIPQINTKYYDRLAKFLDYMDLKELAFEIVQDNDMKFDLAVQLQNLEQALIIADKDQNQTKWKQVGDMALLSGKIKIAIRCFKASDDLSGLLLIYSSLGLKDQLRELGQRALELTKTNVAFSAYFQIADLDACLNVLVKSERFPEAAFFAKTYCPSRVSEFVGLWKQNLQKNSYNLTAQKIADPFDFPEVYADLELCIIIEKHLQQERDSSDVLAHQFNEYQELLSQDFFSQLKADINSTLESVIPSRVEVNDAIVQVHENYNDAEEYHDVDDVEQLE